MKRILKYCFIGFIVAAVSFVLGAAVWLVGTTHGARWLLAFVSHKTELTIFAKSVEGRLAGTLTLDDLTIQWRDGHIHVDQARLAANPLALLAGEIHFQTLFLKNITVTDNAPDKPPVLQWPKVSGLISRLDCAIEQLNAENITYRHLQKKPLQLTKINASVAWKNGYLYARNINVLSDAASITGNILAGFSKPLLEMNINATSIKPHAALEYFHLTGKFKPGQKPEQLAGNLYVSASRKTGDSKPQWELSADAAMTPQGFPIRNLRLSHPDRSGIITAFGMLTFQGTDPFLSLKAEAKEVDWASDVNIPLILSGSLIFDGTATQYSGNFSLVNQGKTWQSVRLAGNFSGNDEKAIINLINGSLMHGSLAGRLDIDWQQGIGVAGTLYARNLDPSVMDKNWEGQINFDLTGRISQPEAGTPKAEIALLLRQSHLHGQSLTGELQATFEDGDILIERLALQGKGFDIHASGASKSKLDFTARVSDFSLLLPNAAGSLTSAGWVRKNKDKVSGVISADAKGLNLDGLQIASARIKASLDERDASPLNVTSVMHKLRYGAFYADTVTLRAEGSQKNHTATALLRSARYEANLAVTGSYHDNQWQGKISRLEGTDRVGPWRLAGPAGITITSESLNIDPLVITGSDAETLKASGRVTKDGAAGFLFVDWNAVKLDRVESWFNQDKIRIKGVTQGNLKLRFLPRNRINLTGNASVRGMLNIQGKPATIRQGTVAMEAGEKGSRMDISVSLSEGGKLKGHFSSPSPATLAQPDEGDFSLELQELDPMLLGSLLPEPLKMEGKIAGAIKGRLLPDKRFTMTGSASTATSKMHLQGQKTRVSFDLRQASLEWIWRDETLSGNFALTLTEYGKLEGQFLLPVPARLPVTVVETGNIQASLAGQVREKGALTTLFPGIIQESRGDMDINLKLDGAWKEPRLSGTAQLSKAGGYFPTAGITIKDASANVRLAGDSVFIDSFRADSGPGHLEGSVVLRLKDGQVTSFEGRLDGDRFQTIYFPELQVQASPRLTFAGTPQKLSVRGELTLPNVQIVGTHTHGPVEASPDVVRKGKAKSTGKKLPFDLDVRIKLALGDSVHFNAGGINAQLGGGIDLQFQEIEKIKSSGEIRVVKGSFATYGVNLEIVRGRLYYASAPINQPALDILALKKVEDVKVGTAISGTLQNPLIKLYSEPPMQDTDILAYIVLGHPMGGSTDQAAILAAAGRALLSTKQSDNLQNQIKSRLGLGSFDFSAGVMESGGKMGYKSIKLTPTGTGNQETGETMLVVGRYLTPALYVSYGRSIFTGTNLFTMRYNLSKNWQVESYTGDSSGVDIYFKLEFN